MELIRCNLIDQMIVPSVRGIENRNNENCDQIVTRPQSTMVGHYSKSNFEHRVFVFEQYVHKLAQSKQSTKCDSPHVIREPKYHIYRFNFYISGGPFIQIYIWAYMLCVQIGLPVREIFAFYFSGK